jgi:hypothetical protein
VHGPGEPLGVGTQAPATIISVDADADPDGPVMPAGDIGLNAPQITELLPNPTGTGNDDTDEFIELYNPNDVAFDLSGFALQTGTTIKHTYVFPDETKLPAKAFVAFYSSDTGLSLSNTTGQAVLLDPFAKQLAQVDPYATAKDGQTWAFANGAWHWTTQATPSAANVIKQVVAAKTTKKNNKSTAASHTSGSASSGVQGASTVASQTTLNDQEAVAPAPIHPAVLAAIGVLAVGYGVYEYRHDLANKIYEFRRDRAYRRAARS